MTNGWNAQTRTQAAVGAGVLLVGLLMAWGATGISSEAGYGGVGPNFMPLLVSAALTVCGALMMREAWTGGFRQMPEPDEADGEVQGAWWPGLVWISAGLLFNAATISLIGFILSCTACYLLAVQGLRRAAGQAIAPRSLAVDGVSGLLIAAPVYWTFTQFLGISLPGLTSTGWL